MSDRRMGTEPRPAREAARAEALATRPVGSELLGVRTSIGNRAFGRWLARCGAKCAPGADRPPALTPQEMWQQVFYKRGLESRYPPHAVEEARARLRRARARLRRNPRSKALAAQVRRLEKRLRTAQRNRSESLPARGEIAADKRPLGHGTKTVAAVQIVDGGGRQVAFALGEYQGGGGLHAEEQALGAIRSQLEHRGVSADGRAGKDWRVVVVVDQSVCSDRCRPALRAFADAYGISHAKVVAHHPTPLAGSKAPSPKTTSRTAHHRASGIPAADPGEAVLAHPPPAAPRPPAPSGGGRPSADTAPAKAPPAKPTAPKVTKGPSKPAPPPAPKLVDVEVDVAGRKLNRARIKGTLRLGGKLVRGAPHGLAVWNALSQLGQVLDKLDALSSGGVDSATRKVIDELDAAFPSPAQLAVDDIGALTAAEFQGSATHLEGAGDYVDEHGALAVPPAQREDEEEILARIGWHVGQVDRYARTYPDIEQLVLDYRDELVPLVMVGERHRAFVAEVGREVFELAKAYAWVPVVGEQLGFMYLQIDHAAHQYSAICGRMSSILYEYDRWLDQADDVADWAEDLISDWGPRWEAGGRRVVGTN